MAFYMCLQVFMWRKVKTAILFNIFTVCERQKDQKQDKRDLEYWLNAKNCTVIIKCIYVDIRLILKALCVLEAVYLSL